MFLLRHVVVSCRDFWLFDGDDGVLSHLSVFVVSVGRSVGRLVDPSIDRLIPVSFFFGDGVLV